MNLKGMAVLHQARSTHKQRQTAVNQHNEPIIDIGKRLKQMFPGLEDYGRFYEAPKVPVDVLSRDEVLRYFGVRQLSDLCNDHMSKVQKQRWAAIIGAVVEWRQRVDDIPHDKAHGRMLILSSPENGNGKTEIARALMHTFNTINMAGDEPTLTHDPYRGTFPNFSITNLASFFSMHKIFKEEWKGDEAVEMLRGKRVVVWDDLGKEGVREFIAAPLQVDFREDRYHQMIDAVYGRCRSGHPVNVIVTTNLTYQQLEQHLSTASWSRVQEMCPMGNFLQISGVPRYRELLSGRGGTAVVEANRKKYETLEGESPF